MKIFACYEGERISKGFLRQIFTRRSGYGQMAALLTCEKNNMTAFFHFLLALAVILALAWLVSYDRQKIRIRYILQLIIIEIALAFFFLHAESGLWLVKNISGFLLRC